MIIPAHEATRDSCATSHCPIFGSVSPAHSSTFCDTCSVHACSVNFGGGATTFVWPSGVIAMVIFVPFVLAEMLFVREDDGNSLPRHVSRKGRLDIHLLRSLCIWRE